MSFQVDTALVQTYKSNIEIKFQQRGSRLRPHVRVEPTNAEFDFYDRITQTSAVEVTTRHGDTPLISTPHDRRRVGLRDFDWADLIDRRDRIRMLADPTSSYTINAVYALGRRVDEVIISAAFGNAFSGKTGATTVAFPASQEIAANFVESGAPAASNLTIGKLRRAKFLLDSQEAVDDDEPRMAIVSASQVQSLLRTTEVTSADFNTVKALVAGEVDTFMGFLFVRTELLTKVGDERECIFYAKNGLLLAMGMDTMVDVGPRRDKRNSVQVYVAKSFDATRMYEEKVIRVRCDETT